MPDAQIPMTEYDRRRKKLCTQLKGSVGMIFAGEQADPLHDDFRPHPHFEYLTGVTDEPGAVLVLDPSNKVESRRAMLFLRPLNPEVEKWDGYRLEISTPLRERTGVRTIYRTNQLGRFLQEPLMRTRSAACLHPLARIDEEVSPDLQVFRKAAERIPGLEIVERTDVLARMRSVKSKSEIAVMQRAVDISAMGYEAVLSGLRPGLTEFDVQEMLEHAYRSNGSRGPAYGTIAGAGINSTVLHYRANDQIIEDGDLVCIDSGAEYRGYGADVTRTFPANGRFTDRQREIYETVLKAEMAAIRLVKPGVTFAELDRIARAVITKAGFGDYFIHSIGHHLGLETHDITPTGALREGSVITIEPGIYIPEERIGVRIEDDILVTKSGSRNLSQAIPKTVAAIEKAMS